MAKNLQRIGNLYNQVISFENLYNSFLKAKKGTKGNEAEAFNFNLEIELIKLREELKQENYEPKPYRFFTIKDPKEREISVASFRDRIVHHAIVNILEEFYEKIFIFDSYATRKNKGTHLAIKRAQSFMKKNEWYFKADIKKYFGSIDHLKLLMIIERKIKDKKLLNLIEKIVSNSNSSRKGIPIGNLTSQFFANVYLDCFDHFIKEELKVKFYIRYMDDFVFFANDKNFLKEVSEKMSLFLQNNLSLTLKERATYLNKRINGLSFLGTRIFSNLIRLHPDNLKRSLKRLNKRKKQFKKGLISEKTFLQSSSAIIEGNLANYTGKSLRNAIIYPGDYRKRL